MKRSGFVSHASLLELGRTILRRARVLLVYGGEGSGKSFFARALAELHTGGGNVAHVRLLEGTGRLRELFGRVVEDEEGAVRFRAGPFWRSVLESRLDPRSRCCLILDNLEDLEDLRLLSRLSRCLQEEVPLPLHGGARCLALEESEYGPTLVCHSDCSECFFLGGSMDVPASRGVREIVPPRILIPANVSLIGVMTSEDAPGGVPPRIPMLRLPPPPPGEAVCALGRTHEVDEVLCSRFAGILERLVTSFGSAALDLHILSGIVDALGSEEWSSVDALLYAALFSRGEPSLPPAGGRDAGGGGWEDALGRIEEAVGSLEELSGVRFTYCRAAIDEWRCR